MISIPDDLLEAVQKLKIEDPSDERSVKRFIEKEYYTATDATIAWLAALVKRNGAKFDEDNPEHTDSRPTSWP